MTAPVLLDCIRESCAAVASVSRHVRIDHSSLAPYAAALPSDLVHAPFYDNEHHYRGDPESTAAFIMTLDAINFGSGWFPVLAKRPGMSGYYTIASSLADRFRAAGPMSAADLADITPIRCATLFGQDPDGPATELMSLFATALNELGNWLRSAHDGHFLAPIEAAHNSAASLAASLADALPGFRDVA
ncbi:MAG: queuosine salvage family protein, partial [Thermomicrobiales bacterium]